MNESEYRAAQERIEKYKSLVDTLRSLKRHRAHCESGVLVITPDRENKKNHVYCDFKCMGDGFQELVTQKVLEAFDEQISRIEKQMEKL